MFQFIFTIVIYPITQIIEFVFVFSQKIFRETGFSIVCVSIAISVLCLPLYLVAEQLQEKERIIQNILFEKKKKIKAVFKKDEQYLILSTYYRQNNYHPIFAMRSSFGLLIQIPFFMAAYSYLSHLQELQGVSFLFIKDLGKSDSLIQIAGGINLLPILMTLINCVSGTIYERGPSINNKIQIYGLAALFLILLYDSPSGLVIYWTVNNIFSMFKNAYLKLQLKNKHFLLYSIISLVLFSLSWYTLFLLQGSPKTRILISFISFIIGIIPWVIPLILNFIKKIKFVAWKKKETLFLFIFSIFILWSISGIFIPSMLIASSPQEFSYIDTVKSPLFYIFNTATQAFGLFVFWPIIIYLFFSKRIKRFFSILAIIISFSALLNIFVFPGNYGAISSELVFTNNISHNTKEITINLIALTICSVFIFIMYIYGFKKFLSSISLIFIMAILLFSVKNIYAINNEYNKLSEYYSPEYNTLNEITPIFHLSKYGKNVLIIMLDMAESVFIPYIFEESPYLFQKYEGFTFYPNTVTFNGWTTGGAPPIFGGYEYTPNRLNYRSNIPLNEKINETLLLMPKLFSKSDFFVTITDPPYADANWIPDLRIYDKESNVSAFITDGTYTDLWLKRNNIALPPQSDVLKRNILWYSIFRESPLIFRKEIYFTGSWCAPFSEHLMRLFLNGYAVLDYMDELTVLDSVIENSAILIVNNTAHKSLLLQAPEYKPSLIITDFGNSHFSKEAWFHVNASAIKRLSEYFDFLRYNDLYDNTRIIIVSDHGCLDASYVTKTNLPFHVDQFNPLLLIKDFNEKGEMKTDTTFMTNADVPVIAMKGIIDNPINPFTGNAITSHDKNDTQLILIDRVQRKNAYEIDINSQNTYYVRNNIFDSKNWTKQDILP